METSVELISKVPLGLALPTVAFMGHLTVLQKVTVAPWVLELLQPPWASMFPKVPLVQAPS